MAITKASQLRTQDGHLLEAIRKSASALSAESNVFLAHSSRDKTTILLGAIRTLRQHGGRVYADLLDPEAKGLTPREFGEFFSRAIADSGRLIVLATEATRSSRWVPWELGLGHGLHGVAKAAVWPVVEAGADEGWTAQEYFAAYPRVEWARLNSEECWAVRDPSDNAYWKLDAWLQL